MAEKVLKIVLIFYLCDFKNYKMSLEKLFSQIIVNQINYCSFAPAKPRVGFNVIHY